MHSYMGKWVQEYMGAQVQVDTGRQAWGCRGMQGPWVHRCTSPWAHRAPFVRGRAAPRLFGCSFRAGSHVDPVTVLGPAKHILQNCPRFGTWGSSREEWHGSRADQARGRAAWGSATDQCWEGGTQMWTHPYTPELALPGTGID